MESVGIIRALWRRRLLTGLGIVLALAVGIAALRGGTASSGFALERVLVNTPASLVADSEPPGSDSIALRASFISALLTTDRVRASIAKELGVTPDEVALSTAQDATPQVETPLAEKAIAAAPPRAPYVATVGADPSLPILSVRSAAPTVSGAVELARLTVAQLGPVAREALPARSAVKVERQGRLERGMKTISPSPVKGLAAALLLLIAWCVAIVAIDARRRGPRLVGVGPAVEGPPS